MLLRVVSLLRLMVGRVLPLLLLLLLSVALAATSTPSCAAWSAASVFCNTYVCAGGLRKGALQHVQGRDHRALFHLALLVLMGPMVVVGRCHLQSLGLQLKLELGGLGLRLRLMFT